MPDSMAYLDATEARLSAGLRDALDPVLLDPGPLPRARYAAATVEVQGGGATRPGRNSGRRTMTMALLSACVVALASTIAAGATAVTHSTEPAEWARQLVHAIAPAAADPSRGGAPAAGSASGGRASHGNASDAARGAARPAGDASGRGGPDGPTGPAEAPALGAPGDGALSSSDLAPSASPATPPGHAGTPPGPAATPPGHGGTAPGHATPSPSPNSTPPAKRGN
jgi:hypothetical protein